MSDFGIEPDYESDFEDLEVVQPKQKAPPSKHQSKAFDKRKSSENSERSASPKSRHSSSNKSKNSSRNSSSIQSKHSDHFSKPKQFSRKSSRNSSNSSKNFAGHKEKQDSDYENEYENSFEEDSDDREKHKKSNEAHFSVKRQETGSSRYPPKVPSRGSSNPRRNSNSHETPGYSSSPMKLGKKLDFNGNKLPRVQGNKPGSQKSSVRLSKNSTLENLKPRTEATKKNKQMLEKENKKLRDDLKSLNDQLTKYLDTAAEMKSKNDKNSKQEREIKVNPDEINDKRLRIYQDEYKKIKDKYDRVNDSEYLIELKEQIKKKEKLTKDFEKRNRELEKSQKDRSKKIENFDDKELAEQKIKFIHLQEEYSKVDDSMKALQDQMTRQLEWYQINKEKEVELREKLEKSQPEEFQTHYSDSKMVKKYSQLQTTLQGLEKTKTATQSQLKVQEYTVKTQKDAYLKELAELQRKIKEKTEELKVLRLELDETAMFASSNNMGKLVSLLNRPRSEKGPLEAESNNDSYKGPFKEDVPTNLSTSQAKAKSEFDLNVKPKFNFAKPGNFEDSESKKEVSEKPALKQKPPKKKVSDEIDEDIPEDVESPLGKEPGFLKKLDESVEKKKKEVKKKSILEELEDETQKPQPKVVEVKKKSLFEELEEETKEALPKQPSPKRIQEKPPKSSIFDELEKPRSKDGFRPLNEAKKPIFNELEEKPGFNDPSKKFNEKPSFLQQNERKADISGFNPVKAPADELFARKDSSKNEGNRKLGLFDELESKKDQDPWRKIEEKPNFLMEGNEKKNELFGNINVSDPSKKRNRNHLAKENEKKDDKIAALASNAANHDFFGGFNEEKPVNSNIQSKLLPIRPDSREKKNEFNMFSSNNRPESRDKKNDYSLFSGNNRPASRDKKNEFNMFSGNDGSKKPEFDSGFRGISESSKNPEPFMEFKKPAAKVEARKNYDLDEEDLLL
jgi:hypothetical protein